MLSINKETWMEILEDLRNDSTIHPVPSCGNFNFIKVIDIDDKEDIHFEKNITNEIFVENVTCSIPDEFTTIKRFVVRSHIRGGTI